MMIGEPIWYYVVGLVFCVFAQFAIIVMLLIQQRRYKQEERALRASEAMYRLLTDNAYDMISRHAADGRILYVSPACQRLMGYHPNQTIGQAIESFVHPDDLQKTWDVIEEAVTAGNGSYSTQHRLRHADGRWVWTETKGRLLRDNNGKLAEIHCLVRDITDRKRIETALRTSEEKFSTLFRLLPVITSVSSLQEGRVLEVNDAFTNSLGYTREEIVGKTSTEVNLWTTPAARRQFLETIQQHGAIREKEFEVRTKSGALLTVLFSSEVIEIGQQPCLINAMIDITVRKQVENALRESEEKYRLLYENMVHGVISMRADGTFEDANPAAFEIFGAPPGAFGKQPYLLPRWKVIREDGSDFALEDMPAMLALSTGKPVRDVTAGHYIPPKNAYVWVSITAIPQFQPGETRPSRVFVTFHDITKLIRIEQELRRYQEQLEELVEERTAALQHEIAVRKQTEQFLRESEEKYRLIAENATDVIWTANTAERFTYISPSVQRLRGYTTEEAMPQTFEQIVTTESWEKVSDLLSPKYADEEGPLRFEIEQTCKDGSTVWVESIVRRLYDASGERTGILGISRDISERKQAEAALQQAKDAAEAANLAKSMFLSQMSHELRTPLNAILGFTQLLARETTLSPLQREYVDTIDLSGGYLLKLINNILSLSKIEAGHIPVNSANVDLWQTLTTIEKMIRGSAEQKGLEFNVERMPDVPQYINTDENKLRQVLINLLGNAVKFTEKGSVALNVSNVRFAAITDARDPSQSHITYLKFDISDTGPGIRSEDLSTIFEAFHQASHPQDAEGTGLGLAISHKFVQLLDGELQAHSELGNGSVFTFAIPVEVVEHDGLLSLSSSQVVIDLAPGQSLVRILVAEDHAENRRFFIKLLASAGFDVRAVSNGREAVIQAREWLPHLILMDMRMPVMDGYEATRRIRELEEYRKIPIIAVTASVFEDERQQVLAAGCNALLCKPLSTSELFETIQTYLDVQYVYAEEDPTPQTDTPSSVLPAHLSSDALAQLPRDLLDSLAQAVLQINIDATEQAIAAIRERDRPIADVLSAMTKKLRYREIWECIPPFAKGNNG